MTRYNAPGNAADFARGSDPSALAEGWHDKIRQWIENRTSPTSAFFDALDSAGDIAPISWEAFPLTIRSWFGTAPDPERARHESAETLKPWLPEGRAPRAVRNGQLAESLTLFRRQQDEYCEWFTHRDNAGAITKVDFTCEGPEYWEHIGNNDSQLCLALYREHVDPTVELADLYWDHGVAIQQDGAWVLWAAAGDYNTLNKWTTTHGVMHLTHEANSLRAEINLAADATVLRSAGGKVVDDPAALICCAGYGGASRSSDPLIGFGVNRAVAGGRRVGLANPVGLYIESLNKGAFTDDDGDPLDVWRVTRGDEAGERVLRATFTPPDGGTVLVGGNLLEFGGQITDHIQMVLYGVVETNPTAPTPQPCSSKCCVEPTRPSFRVTVAPGTDCSGIPWDQLAPIGPDAAPGLASVAEADGDIAGIAVTERAVPAHRR